LKDKKLKNNLQLKQPIKMRLNINNCDTFISYKFILFNKNKEVRCYIKKLNYDKKNERPFNFYEIF